ncbi:MAG: hypothetical protein EXR08_04120 [Alphaproteobacteria bacterium]|nr:hypothetical protein [Alphaproteobacteria bacterium]
MAVSQNRTLRPDSKGRIALGDFAKGISSFRISQEKDGRLILEPFREIPAREAWLFENPAALGKVRKGLKDASEGKLSRRGDFSKFTGADDS